jgi:hypothetical protein
MNDDGQTEKDDQMIKKRLQQCVAVLKKLTDDLGIPYSSHEVQAVKKHFDHFIRSGESWSGTVDFQPWERTAHINLMRSGRVELTLRANRKSR